MTEPDASAAARVPELTGVAVTLTAPWPGDDRLEASLAVVGDLGDVPDGVTGVPAVPLTDERDGLVRTCAALDQLPVELGPHGWKLADRPGRDAERAAARWRDDLEAFAIAASGYTGPVLLGATGPWTLAAELYLARGDRVLTDHGAVREIAQALAAGMCARAADVRRLVPGAEVHVRLDESLIGQVNAGVIPTFSGYSRIRAVPGPDLVARLEPVVGALQEAGVRVAVHVGEAWLGIAPVALAGADGVGLRLGPWNERAWEHVARAVERGMDLWPVLAPPATSQCSGPDVRALADQLLVPWRRIGLETRRLDRTVLSLTGHGTHVQEARGRLRTLAQAGLLVAERAAD